MTLLSLDTLLVLVVNIVVDYLSVLLMRQRPRVVVVVGSRDGEVQVRRSRARRPLGRAVDAHAAAA